MIPDFLTTTLSIYSLSLAAGIVGIWIAALANSFHTARTERVEKALSQQYMRVVSAVMFSTESVPSQFPMLERRGAREVLARVLTTVATSVYGSDVVALGRMAADNDIDQWLLHKVERSRGVGRAYYMSLLATLPLTSEMVIRIARYADDRCRLVRFYTLMIRIGHDSSSALRELAKYREPFNSFELAEIVAMLRRGLLPVACEPLLTSASRNLRAVGLNIVREFGIEEVNPLLLDIVAYDTDEGIAQDALYALVAMHSSLTSREIVTSIRNMHLAERRSLCRRLVHEGYSATVLERLFGNGEGQYAQRLVATYKRRIVCSPQL